MEPFEAHDVACDVLAVQGSLWATALEGTHRRTFFVADDENIGASISTNIVCTRGGALMYGLDTPDDFPAVWDGSVAVPLVSFRRKPHHTSDHSASFIR